MASRLQTRLSDLRRRGEKALGLFLTNGFPDPAATGPLLETIARSGADFIELGMPFSDPLAEGLPIQRSSARALSHGVTMADAFATATAFRRQSDLPLLLMGYINPVYRYGIGNFCREARSSGVDGLIIPDLPLDEAHLINAEAQAAGLDLIYLIAPNTSDARMRAIDQCATGFVYAVSVTGLTGTALHAMESINAYLQRARATIRQNPLLVGFGIRSHEDATRLSRHTDGYIVGSALVKTVEHLWDDTTLSEAQRLDRVAAFVRTLKYGTSVEYEHA